MVLSPMCRRRWVCTLPHYSASSQGAAAWRHMSSCLGVTDTKAGKYLLDHPILVGLVSGPSRFLHSGTQAGGGELGGCARPPRNGSPTYFPSPFPCLLTHFPSEDLVLLVLLCCVLLVGIDPSGSCPWSPHSVAALHAQFWGSDPDVNWFLCTV